jgi:hypothetical protein
LRCLGGSGEFARHDICVINGGTGQLMEQQLADPPAEEAARESDSSD